MSSIDIANFSKRIEFGIRNVECGNKKKEKSDFKYLKSGIPDFLPVFIRKIRVLKY